MTCLTDARDLYNLLATSDDELFIEEEDLEKDKATDTARSCGSCPKCGRDYKRKIYLDRHVQACNGAKARRVIVNDEHKIKERQCKFYCFLLLICI